MKDVHSEYIYHAMIKKENKGYHEKETNLMQCIVCFFMVHTRPSLDNLTTGLLNDLKHLLESV